MSDDIFNQRGLDMALRSDFPSFIHKVATYLNPSRPYQANWHILAIAWHLEQVRLGKIKRLIICLPPRSFKSTIASVSYPAWLLGHDPAAKIVSITYGADLTAKFSFDFRRVIASDFYQRIFTETRILEGKNTETEVVLTAGGGRLGTSVTGSITGRGGDFVICDDPMKAQDVSSDLRREATNQIFQSTILTRLDSQMTGAFVVVMQRLHANDFVGALLEKTGHNWTVLNLPAVAEEDQTIQIGDEKYHVREAGEVLHAEREPFSVLEQLRSDMGPDAFQAQYQQAPVPRGGLMIKFEWIKYHSIVDHKTLKRGTLIQSWDTAGKEGARNSFSVCTTWLRADNHYYLLDMVRGRFDYVTLKDTACNYAHRFRPKAILIEDASTGIALAAELQKAVPFVVKPVPVRLDKVDRMFEQQGKFASGRVLFPKDAPFLPDLLKELLSFPQSKTTDQVDSISQALAYQGSTYNLDNVR